MSRKALTTPLCSNIIENGNSTPERSGSFRLLRKCLIFGYYLGDGVSGHDWSYATILFVFRYCFAMNLKELGCTSWVELTIEDTEELSHPNPYEASEGDRKVMREAVVNFTFYYVKIRFIRVTFSSRRLINSQTMGKICPFCHHLIICSILWLAVSCF